jgi:hypothetical protein
MKDTTGRILITITHHETGKPIAVHSVSVIQRKNGEFTSYVQRAINEALWNKNVVTLEMT